jgi:hypothetical protein
MHYTRHKNILTLVRKISLVDEEAGIHPMKNALSTPIGIINDKFYLRTQHWFLLPPSTPPTLPTSFLWWELCWHVLLYGDTSTYLSRCLRSRLVNHGDGTSCSEGSGLKQCEECLTEFQIDTKDLQPRGFAIVVTE